LYKCGEKWHENGKCKEEENIDKLFETYSRRYNLKKCPYCNIVVFKNGGCNHIKCQYCGKDWCWLCNEIFNTTEEHYGNINSKCYNQMMNNDNETAICSKCNAEINNNNFKRFQCDDIICNNCLIEYLLTRSLMIIFPVNIINCLIIGCRGIRLMTAEQIIEFINESNNEKLIKKYNKSILLFKYLIKPIFVLKSYFEILISFYKLIAKLFSCCRYSKFNDVLEIIGIIFGCIFIPVYVIIIPVFSIFVLKRLYYITFLPEIKNQYNNKLITNSIIVAEEILSIVFIFTLFILHYLFFSLCLPIFGLALLIRNLYYHIWIC